MSVLSDSDLPPTPTIEARLEGARLFVSYAFADKSSRRFLFTTVDQDGLQVARSVQRAEESGEVSIELPYPTDGCTVRVSALGGRQRGPVVSQPLTSEDPSDRERGLAHRISREEIAQPSISSHHGDPGLSAIELLGKLNEPARMREMWLAVSTERRDYRRARRRVDEVTRLERRSHLNRWRVAGALVTGLAAIGGLVVFAPAPIWIALALLAVTGLMAWFLVPEIRAQRAARVALPPSSERDAMHAAARARRIVLEEALRQKAIRPALREIVNEGMKVPYGLTLDFTAQGLAEKRVPAHEIPTAASDDLDRLTEAMGSGSIGIAGRRGVGKTTLIRYFCERKEESGWLTAMVSAPVEYDARDFVLALFGDLCRRVLDSRPVGGWSASVARPRRHPLTLVRDLFASAGTTVVAATTVSVLSDSPVGGSQLAGFLAIGFGVGVVGLVIGISRLRRRDDDKKDPEDLLQDAAAKHLGKIRFQQSWSFGYSGKLTLPMAAEAGAEQSESYSENNRTFPELVSDLKSFLGLIVNARGGAVVGIDEMDKMATPEAAQRFLNEIKGVFGVDGCIFLVSISENAMTGFERRGLPFRDVFDSSFADVLTVRPLDAAESSRLLRRRVLGLTAPFLHLCHVMSGGLARDLIRVARQLDRLQDRVQELEQVTHHLIAEELARKVEATSLSARSVRLEPDTARFIAWMRQLTLTGLTPTAILEHCASVAPERNVAQDGDSTGHDLEWLRIELASFAYYSATVLEVFDGFTGETAIRTAEQGDLFETLATARQEFEINPRLAWAVVDNARASHVPPLRTAELPVAASADAQVSGLIPRLLDM